MGAADLRAGSGGRRAEAGADGVNAMWLILAFIGGIVVGIHLGGLIALRILTEADGSEANATIEGDAQRAASCGPGRPERTDTTTHRAALE